MSERATLRARLSCAVLAFVAGCAAPRSTRQSDASAATAGDVFLIRHVFAADPKTVFDAWADPERLARWMGPSGARMAFRSAHVIEGGASQWTMTTPDGLTKYGRLRFKIIDSPRLLVYAQNFTDEDGRPARLPIAAPYPEILLTTVRFARLGAERTEVTVRWDILGDATEAERQTFREMKPVMTKGWGESFEKLEAILARSR